MERTIYKDDSDEMVGLLSNDDLLNGANTLASLDDPVEYPHLGTLNQSKMIEKPVRKLKRQTSIAPTQRKSMKKPYARLGPQESKEHTRTNSQ